MAVLAPDGEVVRSPPVVGLAIHKLLVSVDDVVSVELLATTHAGKYMATLLSNFVLVMCWQRLESLVTDITEVNPLSLLRFLPHTDLIQRLHEFPHKMTLETCRDVVSRLSQTSQIQPTFGPNVDKCAIYIWVQLDDRVEM